MKLILILITLLALTGCQKNTITPLPNGEWIVTDYFGNSKICRSRWVEYMGGPKEIVCSEWTYD